MDSITVWASKYLILVPVLAVAYVFWKLNKQDRKQMLFVLVTTGILAIIIAKLGSHLYTNPRPQFKDHVIPLFTTSDYNGFPSDHTLLASVLGFSLLAYSKKLGWAVLAVALIVGWARVAAGVHHFIDVLASLLIAGLSYWLANYLLSRRKTPLKAVK
jgi:membrane-associated phospholipid phosphatase